MTPHACMNRAHPTHRTLSPLPRPERRDCVAGHVRFELRNVAANYPFERSHRFAEIQPNSGFGDYSRLSCGVGDAQLERNKRIVDTEFFTEGSYVSHILLAPDPPIRPVEGVERACHMRP